MTHKTNDHERYRNHFPDYFLDHFTAISINVLIFKRLSQNAWYAPRTLLADVTRKQIGLCGTARGGVVVIFVSIAREGTDFLVCKKRRNGRFLRRVASTRQ